MKMKKIPVDRLDASRVLLTEVLPYETPLFFSNALFYKHDRAQREGTANEPVLIQRLLDKGRRESRAAYGYPINHSAGKTRTLSIIHPAVQRRFVDFYAENADVIVYLCSKSSFSLRSPARVASQYVENTLMDREESDLRDLSPEEERGGFDIQTKFASSFFEYKRYSFLFKFYQSLELLKLEKRFRYLLQFDISRCFSSIYTHSVTWAAKNKDFSKANKDALTIEGAFDRLMQASNYDETHGIVIGPEASRIFAEVILQRVDINVQERLANEGLRLKVDYQVRRYVDDYFVFAIDAKTAHKVFLAFQNALEEYKLYINESKTLEQRTPLMSPRSAANIRAGQVLDEFFKEALEPREARGSTGAKIFRARKKRPSWIRIVEHLKLIEKETKAGYEGLVGYCLSALRRRCASVFSQRHQRRIVQQEQEAADFALAVLEIAFFLYSMDMRVRPTYLLAQILSIIERASGWLHPDVSELLRKEMLDQLIDSIDRFKANRYESGIEMSNLLIISRKLASDYELPVLRLAECFQIRYEQTNGSPQFKGFDRVGYFEAVTLLYYMQSKAEYTELREQLIQSILLRFESSMLAHRDSELMLLFFDLLACPFVSDATKHKLVKNMAESAGTAEQLKIAGETTRIVEYCRDNVHWVDWSGDLSLVALLEKKELRTPYGE